MQRLAALLLTIAAIVLLITTPAHSQPAAVHSEVQAFLN